jgi:hypothetical protein
MTEADMGDQNQIFDHKVRRGDKLADIANDVAEKVRIFGSKVRFVWQRAKVIANPGENRDQVCHAALMATVDTAFSDHRTLVPWLSSFSLACDNPAVKPDIKRVVGLLQAQGFRPALRPSVLTVEDGPVAMARRIAETALQSLMRNEIPDFIALDAMAEQYHLATGAAGPTGAADRLIAEAAQKQAALAAHLPAVVDTERHVVTFCLKFAESVQSAPMDKAAVEAVVATLEAKGYREHGDGPVSIADHDNPTKTAEEIVGRMLSALKNGRIPLLDLMEIDAAHYDDMTSGRKPAPFSPPPSISDDEKLGQQRALAAHLPKILDTERHVVTFCEKYAAAIKDAPVDREAQTAIIKLLEANGHKAGYGRGMSGSDFDDPSMMAKSVAGTLLAALKDIGGDRHLEAMTVEIERYQELTEDRRPAMAMGR